MANLKTIRDRQQALADDMRALNAKAEAAKRGFTDEENRTWDRMRSEYDALDASRKGAEFDLHLAASQMPPGPQPVNFVDQKGNAVRAFRHGESIARGLPVDYAGFGEYAGMGPNDYRGMSIGDFARAMVTGPRNEIEHRALAEGTGSAGGYTVPAPVGFQFYDLLRARSACSLAGAQTIVMDSKSVSFAKLATDVPAAWRAENAAVATSDPTFAQVTLTPQSLAGLVTCSRELVQDSLNIGAMLSTAFASKFAAMLDAACLVGSGSSPVPRGIVNQSGVPTFYCGAGADGGAISFDKMLDLRESVETNNSWVSAFVAHPRTARAISTIRDTLGQWIPIPEWSMSGGYQEYTKARVLSTTGLPITETRGVNSDCSTMVAGNFESLLIGMRETINLSVVPGLGADNGQITFVAHLRAACSVVRATDFAVLRGIRAV